LGPVAQSVKRLTTGWTVRGSNPGGDEIFRTCPDRPWSPSSILYNGYRVFSGGKERPGRDADTTPILVPWSRKSTAIPLFPLWAVRPVQSLSACTRVHFTFLYIIIIIIIIIISMIMIIINSLVHYHHHHDNDYYKLIGTLLLL